MALAFCILRNVEQAKDEVQKAFIQLAKQDCPTIQNKAAWLVRVCRNSALKSLNRDRRTAFRPEVFWKNVPDEPTGSGGDSLVHQEYVGLLFHKLEALPEKQREVIRLHYLVGLKAGQIGEVLGLKTNNVYQLHFAGLANLRQLMDEEKEAA